MQNRKLQNSLDNTLQAHFIMGLFNYAGARGSVGGRPACKADNLTAICEPIV
jgi:hypothetical protein